MTRRSYKTGERWAIVLAGGEGTRLSDMTLRVFGERRPKQYCSFLGRRTMFDHTMERAIGLVGRRRVVTVIGKGHMRFLTRPTVSPLFGYVVEQPRNCDTAPGIYLPLAYVLAHDAEATVALFPTDHFVSPNFAFLSCMDRALSLAERRPDRYVLAAAVADRPETEYGWIQPGAALRGEDDMSAVQRFHEKPDAQTAETFFREGFLWNTLNMAVRASTLWTLGWRYHPAMMERFERLRAAIGSPAETEMLARVYQDMPQANFSKGILERAASQGVVMPMRDLEWSDWGRPERIQETLSRRVLSEPAVAAPSPLSPLPTPALAPAA